MADETPQEDHAHRVVETVARESYGRLVAYLSARTRDVAGAEDALAEALMSALTTWPRDGVPRQPEAWLLTVARNRLVDQSRRFRVREEHATTQQIISDESQDPAAPDPIPDERLKLLFVCAHPAIDPDIHTPLMLQTVLGLSVQEIARAFLVSPDAMGQRLVRAKAKIRHAGIAFDVPEKQELPPRLEAVLNAIYAAYGSGWADAAGIDPRASGLAAEAIWLARVLRVHMPEHAEVHGLLSLMLHCEARRPARRSEDGQFIPLDQQSPRLWIEPMIAEAEQELAIAGRLLQVAAHVTPGIPQTGRFQIEAAIQSVHADRARTGHTDWNAIALFYAHLVQLSPTLGARVGHAAAIAEAKDVQAALALLDAIPESLVKAYQPYWAVRAHLLQRLKRKKEAAEAFELAIGLAEDEAVRGYLLDRKGNG